MSTDNPALEKALIEGLGLNKDALVPGTLRLDFEGNLPHLYFESNYVVPPELLAKAFAAMAPPAEPEPTPPPIAQDVPPAPFPEAPAPGAEDPEAEKPKRTRQRRPRQDTPEEPVPEA